MVSSTLAMLRWWTYKLRYAIKEQKRLVDNVYVIEHGLLDDVKKIDYGNYLRYQLNKPNKKYDDLFIDLSLKHGKKYLDAARRLNNANYSRVKRLKRRIARYLSLGQCLFVTLTFKDDVLDSTNVETRRKYVQKYLKSKCQHYIANIDFGSKNEREHYHAVMLIDHVDNTWEYGFSTYLKIHKTKSEIALSKYVLKLSNHAVKETTKRNFCIYSRS